MFLRNFIILKICFVFVIHIFRFLEIILQLNFLYSWWSLKSSEDFLNDFGDYKHIKSQIALKKDMQDLF